MSGKVYLVGAGPSDAGLLTLKGYELLQTADVVVHDALVGGEVLGLIPPTGTAAHRCTSSPATRKNRRARAPTIGRSSAWAARWSF